MKLQQLKAIIAKVQLPRYKYHKGQKYVEETLWPRPQIIIDDEAKALAATYSKMLSQPPTK